MSIGRWSRFRILATAMTLFVAVGANSLQPQSRQFDFSCVTFHADLTEAELVARFGRENVTHGSIVGADDGPFEGTILFASQPHKRVEIAWNDTARKEKLRWVRVQGDSSLWRPAGGLALGDDLLTIEKRNGWPFRLSGFTSETHGLVEGWSGGRFQSNIGCPVKAMFQPPMGYNDPVLRQVTRLRSVSSGHPAMQKINPKVVEIWIQYFPRELPRNPADALLDAVVFGTYLPMNLTLYDSEVRIQLEQYLRRAEAYVPKPPGKSVDKILYGAWRSYEVRMSAQVDNPNAAALAQRYVANLRPCYEWEGYHGCPEHDAEFTDSYQAGDPNNIFREYLPLFAAHRWLCAAEGYDYEKDAKGAAKSRDRFEKDVAIAQRSKTLLIRKAAERLAERKSCRSPQ